MTSKQPGKSAILQEIDDLMLSIRKHLNKSLLLTSTKKLPMIPQPKCLIGGQLKEYQLQSLSWMVELANNNLSGILADDMGLGKTIQAIAYMSYLYETKGVKGKHLIVVPKNVLNNWKRELQTWNPMFRVVVLPGTEVEREQCIRDFIRPSKFDILIATFQSVQTAERNLKPFCWETFIVDEAHSIKNDQTFLASCLRRFNYKFTLLLTGTPLSNELKELWSLLNFIAPKIFFDGNLFKKIENSVNLECKDQQQKLKYQSEIAAKFKAIISPFLMRRVKSEINLGLKEKKEFTLFISLSDLQLKMYRNYLKYNSVYGAGTGFQMSRQMQLRKICSHPYLFSDIQDPKEPPFGEHLIQNCGKMKLLDKLLNKLLKENHKILIFSQFTIFLKVLEDYCAYREYKYATITGQSSLEDRDDSVEIFSKSKDINLFLISTRAGGIGLNLVAADVVILYDLDWNPQMDRQATDRAYRIGQKNSVKVFKLISINTVEERMLEVQKYKIIWDELVIQKGGLARLKAAQEKLQKLDQNKIAGLDAEEIFKLQQNFDDKTIDEIIMMGEQKDKKKTQQIKAKLEKEFQKLGQIANPFQDLQKGGTKLGDIQYQAERLGHGKQKSKGKLTWKERVEERNGQMMLEKELKTKPYHFFTDEKRALEILKSLKGTEDQKVKDQCQKELRRLGFYDWSRTQFEAFVKANQIHFKEDYKSIAKEIGTKNAKEVLKYSEEYYNKADQIPELKKELKKIMKKQQEFQKNIKIKEAEDKIKAYPDHLFNFKAKYPIQEVSFHSVNRMYYNGIKSSGICLQEQENILSILNPVALAKVNQKHATLAAKFHSFTKLVNHLESKSQEKVEQELQKRYEALKKIYLPSMSKKITQKQVEEDEESAQTAVKPLYG